MGVELRNKISAVFLRIFEGNRHFAVGFICEMSCTMPVMFSMRSYLFLSLKAVLNVLHLFSFLALIYFSAMLNVFYLPTNHIFMTRIK